MRGRNESGTSRQVRTAADTTAAENVATATTSNIFIRLTQLSLISTSRPDKGNFKSDIPRHYALDFRPSRHSHPKTKRLTPLVFLLV